MEKKTLTNEEIIQLKNLHQKRIQLIEGFGLLEIKYQEYLLEKNNLIKDFEILNKTEQEVGEFLITKYGNGTIDLEKGEIEIK